MSLDAKFEDETCMSSDFLRSKKTCCKSACLHCPYGFTLKKFGLSFMEYLPENEIYFEKLRNLLNLTKINFNDYDPSNIKAILIKDIFCGVLIKNHLVIKELHLLEGFKDQGLSREMVESYLF